MKINLDNKSIKNVALASVALLALSSTPLLADNTFSKSTSDSNFAPCWGTYAGSQTYQRQQQRWMAQQGSMMGQGWQGSGGWEHHFQYGRMYDPNNLTTVSGEVVSVDTFTPRGGMSGGMHLQLKTDDETFQSNSRQENLSSHLFEIIESLNISFVMHPIPCFRALGAAN